MSEPSGTSGAAAEKAALWKRLLPILGGVAIVVFVFGWVLPQFIDYESAFRAIGEIDALEWIVLITVAGVRFIPEGWIFVAAQPGLNTRQGTSLFLVANTLANVPPGGLDLVSRYQMTRSWGLPASSATAGAGAGILGSQPALLLNSPHFQRSGAPAMRWRSCIPRPVDRSASRTNT